MYICLVSKLHTTDECFNYLFVVNTCVYNVQSSEILATNTEGLIY